MVARPGSSWPPTVYAGRNARLSGMTTDGVEQALKLLTKQMPTTSIHILIESLQLGAVPPSSPYGSVLRIRGSEHAQDWREDGERESK